MVDGKYIKLAYQHRGYTQIEIANATGYSVRAIQYWIKNTPHPKKAAFDAILDFCDVTIESLDLLGDTEHAA